MSKKGNFIITIVVLSYFVLAFIFLIFFNGCQNTQCYPKRYGQSICQIDKEIIDAKNQRL